MSLKIGDKIISKRKTKVLIPTETKEKFKFYEKEVGKNSKGKVLKDCVVYKFNAWATAGGKRKDPLIVGHIILSDGTIVAGINAPDWKVVE